MTTPDDPIATLRALVELRAKIPAGSFGWFNGYGPCSDGRMRALRLGAVSGAEPQTLLDCNDGSDIVGTLDAMELVVLAVNAIPALAALLKEVEDLRRKVGASK